MKLSFLLFFFCSFLSQATMPEILAFPKVNTLQEAVFFGDIEKVRDLIKRGVDVNNVGGERIIQGTSVVSFNFTRTGQKDLKRIAERRDRLKNTLLTDWLHSSAVVDMEENGITPIFWVRNDNVEIAKLLIENGADVNAKTKHKTWTKFGKVVNSPTVSIPAQSTPLYIAIINNYIKTSKLLIENGADVNAKDAKGHTPLHFAKNLEIVKLLIKNGADVNARKGVSPPLYDTYNIEIAKLLIENGADVNAKSPWGYTPLSNARTVEMAKLLIENGADVNATSYKGKTVCDLVSSRDSQEIKKLIIEKGGICRNLTLLHHFVTNNNDRAVIYFLKKKSGLINSFFKTKEKALNARENKNGNTPLHFAENLEIAKALLKHGANINATNNKGQTPFDTINSKEVKKYIKENGGKPGQVFKFKEKIPKLKKESLWIKVKNLFKK